MPGAASLAARPQTNAALSAFPSPLLADASALKSLSREDLAAVEQIKAQLREAKRAADAEAK